MAMVFVLQGYVPLLCSIRDNSTFDYILDYWILIKDGLMEKINRLKINALSVL
jgi:hypothetical protein